MNIKGLIIFLATGAVAGVVCWLAGNIRRLVGKLRRGKSRFSLRGHIIIGITGAVVGGFAFNLFSITDGGVILDLIINATIGAVILLIIMTSLK